jgi:hypothetical protein
MTALDYDLEFLEDGRTIELISIGMVCDDGREYYAVNRDMPVRKHPQAPVADGERRPEPAEGARRPGHPHAEALAVPLRRRPREAPDDHRLRGRRVHPRGTGPDVELWANYGAYDHVCLAQLWGPMIDLPDGVPMYTNDIQQEARRLGLGWDELPKQETGEHNALADARHNQTVRRWLAEQEARTT